MENSATSTNDSTKRGYSRIFMRSGPLAGAEAVADAAHRFQHALTRSQAGAEIADVGVHGAFIQRAVREAVHQFMPGQRPPRVRRQRRQQAQMGGGQGQHLVTAAGLVGVQINAQFADLPALTRLEVLALHTPQHIPHPQQHFSRAEGLEDVIVRAEFQAQQPV